jgi:signal transduction histidine kinase
MTRLLTRLAAAGWVGATLLRTYHLPELFSDHYLPHRTCYLASPGLIWTNAVTDGLIAVSYAVIFSCLLGLTLRLRKVQDFSEYLWIFFSFGLFIAACGATHVMEVVTVWWPIYPMSAAVKIVCAAASVPTAVLFARATPALSYKIPELIELLLKTRQERDESRLALLSAERILAEQMRADTLIEAANTRLNHILDSTSEGVLKVGSDWTVRYGNRVAFELLPDLVIDKDFWECFPAVAGSYAEDCLRKTMHQRVASDYETHYPPYDRWFRVNVYPTPEGMSIFFTNISKERVLEDRLAAERAALLAQVNSVMDSTSDAILKIGSDWSIVYANRRAREILPDLDLKLSYWACFPGLERTETETLLRRTMDERTEAEWENFYEPYQEHYAVHTYPSPGGLSIFFHSITKRKKLEQQVEAERLLREKRIEALSHMAGGLAHEISNPLAIIQATASDLERLALEEPLLPAEEVRKASKAIVHTSDRAIRILKGLHGFAREAGHDPMEYASVYDIVEQAVQLQEARYARHGVELRVQLAPALPLLLCREVQVGQILTNLLNNAYDAITQLECPERWVSLEAGVDRHCVRIDVIDSGFGIAEEARQHLMEPFFTTKTRGLGLGVGLSLSRAIAVEHGGSLTLLTGTENTCFRLLLPFASGEPECTQEAQEVTA